MRHYLASALIFAAFGNGCATQKSAGDASTVAATEAAACSADARVRVYHAGIAAKGTSGIYNFTLTSASQVPPAKGVNNLTLQVQDAAGQPVSGAALSLKPWMPDLARGPISVPQINTSGTSYNVSKVDLFMPGVWNLVFTVTGPAGTDSATFTLCVNG